MYADNGEVVKLTETEVRQGIESGRFRRDGTVIRDQSNGQIVKFFHEQDSGSCSIPLSLIQINQQFVYQADVPQFMRSIEAMRQGQIYDVLENKYTLVLDHLTEYRSYGKNLDKLYTKCMDASADFDNHVRKLSENIKTDNIENEDTTLFAGALDAYIKILFIFIIASYLIHKSSFSRDQLILQKLMKFRGAIAPLYEKVLARSGVGREGTWVDLDKSIYACCIFSKKHDLYELDSFVAHDSRFSSSLDVISWFKRFRKQDEWGANQPNRTVISVPVDYTWISDKRFALARKLRDILEDIARLERIRSEVIACAESEPIEVSAYLDEILLAY